MWGALQSRGVTGGGEGVVEGVTLFPQGRQRVTETGTKDPAFFRVKTRVAFGADVYRKSTGVSVSGKSAGKNFRQRSTVHVVSGGMQVLEYRAAAYSRLHGDEV